MDIRYLSTDLDVESLSDLSLVVDDLGEEVLVQQHGPVKHFNHASIVVAQSFCSGPDEVVNCFCNLIENLSDEARAIWDTCFTRVFDIGLEWGFTPSRYRFELRPSTIERLAKIGASLDSHGWRGI
ncbi:MAG: hypothetical protein HYX75_20685 [Acidobacteria bacterium]|nr:hypothetical protein [Acidobacteriota bacterium]